MGALPSDAPYALISNIVLLFFVAIEPYLFYVLTTAPPGPNGSPPPLLDPASVVYALDVGGMFFMQAALAQLVVRSEERGLLRLHPVVLRRFKGVVVADFVTALVFAVSALPVFWVETPIGYLRFYMWSASFAVFLITLPRRRRMASAKPG